MGGSFAIHVEGDRWRDTFYREFRHEAIELAQMLRISEDIEVMMVVDERTDTLVEWE